MNWTARDVVSQARIALLGDVRPAETLDDQYDGSLAHPVGSGQFVIGHNPWYIGRSYCPDVIVSEFGSSIGDPSASTLRMGIRPVGRPIGGTTATFRAAVGHIVGLSSKKKMARADTRWVVTVMEHTEAIRDRAVGQFPGEAMSQDPSSGMTKNAVALSHSVGRPYPTGTELGLTFRDWTVPVNLGPEPFLLGAITREVAGPAAVLIVASGNGRGRCTEGRPAGLANAVGVRGIATLSGRLGLHDNLRCCCATPRAVPAAPGHLLGQSIAQMFGRANQ